MADSNSAGGYYGSGPGYEAERRRFARPDWTPPRPGPARARLRELSHGSFTAPGPPQSAVPTTGAASAVATRTLSRPSATPPRPPQTDGQRGSYGGGRGLLLPGVPKGHCLGAAVWPMACLGMPLLMHWAHSEYHS